MPPDGQALDKPYALLVGGFCEEQFGLAENLLQEKIPVALYDLPADQNAIDRLEMLINHFGTGVRLFLADIRNRFQLQRAIRGASIVYYFPTDPDRPVHTTEFLTGVLNLLECVRHETPALPLVYVPNERENEPGFTEDIPLNAEYVSLDTLSLPALSLTSVNFMVAKYYFRTYASEFLLNISIAETTDNLAAFRERVPREFFNSQEESVPQDRYYAARITSPGQIKLEQQILRDPQPHEVLVRVTGCGLCASSIPVWEGREWFQYPLAPGAPGHEAWGIIEKVGNHITTLLPGQKVALLAGNTLSQFCYTTEDLCVLLPEPIQHFPLPGEPLGCAMNIFKRSDIRKDQDVAIIGAGFLGLLLIQLSKSEGARVTAVSKRKSSLQAALDAGADFVCDLATENAESEIFQLTGGKGYERVIECTGKQEPLDRAGKICAIRGRLIIGGYHQDGLRQINLQEWNWKGLDVINAHERDPQVYRQGTEEAIRAILEERMRPAGFYTHYFPFERIREALDLQARAPEGFIKAIVTFD